MMSSFYDKAYFKSILAIIKLLEILILLIAFATVLSFDLNVVYENTGYSKLRFFTLVSAVAWVTCVVVYVLNISRVTRNLPVPWYWVNLILGIIFGLFLLLASGFISSSVIDMKSAKRIYVLTDEQREITECEYINKKGATSCVALEAGAVFGFFAVILFIAEIVINGQKLRRGDYSHDAPVPQPPIDNVTTSSIVGH